MSKTIIKFVEGDLFASYEHLNGVAHGCNCVGAMGAGIAAEFKKRFPKMYKTYRKLCLADKLLPGDIFEWLDGDTMIFNMMTQYDSGPNAKVAFIKRCLSKLQTEFFHEAMLPNREYKLAMPAIGSGIGWLDWETQVKPLFNDFNTYGGTLYVIEKFIPGKPFHNE